MRKSRLLTGLLLLSSAVAFSDDYWQQRVEYSMDIDFHAERNIFEGKQSLKYYNNSPDTLYEVFYHLQYNAFQPMSDMDVRSRLVPDPDPRIGAHISGLSPSEMGYHRIGSFQQDGKDARYTIQSTIMKVSLNEPIAPGGTTIFSMTFKSQVPVQIRRTGRKNAEGVDFTMTQWYPKMAEYDRDGWHTDPYVCREFFGVFGSFDVRITIDSAYTLAGTGVVQNPDSVGHGYSASKLNKKRIRWHFKADNVHDFAWAADPDYIHTQATTDHGVNLHFFHLNDTTINDNWTQLMPKTVALFNIMDDLFGRYPYPCFSVIQGGDGGMEYPMCTMIVGGGKLGGLVSVTVHETIHNWYYGILGSHELKYPWMDEGFTTYAQNVVLDSLYQRRAVNPHLRSYNGYRDFVTQVREEPLTTHADRYATNAAYGNAAYSKGCLFLSQLRYIIGEEAFDRTMLRYFDEWQFRHPTPADFKRIAERESNMQLDWYFEDWIGTTKTIDYGVLVQANGDKTTIVLNQNIAYGMSMPIEVMVVTKTETSYHYIPLDLQLETKPRPANVDIWKVYAPWHWVSSVYSFGIDVPLADIISVQIDPHGMLADVNPANNRYPVLKETKASKKKKRG